MNNIVDALNWRYAVTLFDPEKKVSEEQIHTIMEATRLTASSFGLQPWKFVVVSNQELKEKMRAAGYDQRMFSEASHIVVLAVNKGVDAEYVDKYIADIAKTRNLSVEDLQGFANTMKNSITSKGEEGTIAWSSRQVYIALGTLIAAASVIGVDNHAMEGFDGDQFDELLGLKEMNCHALVSVALGFRLEEDPMAKMAKVRFPLEELVIEKK